jgi:cysteinyl-tRNA synthetase
MRLYNTLTRQIEEFKTIENGSIRFYHCGPTVYWTQHIGNLRGMTMADLMRRSLIFLNYYVNYVRNYTDVGHLTGDTIGDADAGEDRMEKGARREGLTPDEIANKYIVQFEHDTAALNLLPPTHKPRATEYIQPIIEMVQILVEKGYAYVTPKAIYFDVTKAPDYTRLSKQKLELNEQGAGAGDIQDPNKKHVFDFALWFFKTGVHKNALQYWPSPFSSPDVKHGEGFPGWHIECSAMAKKLLGPTIDIHMGGIEHIPTHHTNEIAQSEAANGVEFVHYWLHNEHLTVDGKKMSKSEGTSYTLSEIVAKGYDPLALRYFFLNSHYRSKQNFTWEAMESAQTAYQKLYDSVLNLRLKIIDQNQLFFTNEEKKSMVSEVETYRQQFIDALNNDINIPQALAVVWNVLKSSLHPQQKLPLLTEFDQVLGLALPIGIHDTPPPIIEIPQEIIHLAEQRKQAKGAKNFAKADELRKQIEEKGFIVEDTKEGYIIKKNS